MAQTREVRLPEQAVTKDDILRLIVSRTIQPIFMREYLNREVVIGAIGDRGGGKSGSDAVIAVVDHMMAGRPVFSNMDINCAIEVDDNIARGYGLNSGGVVLYQSEPLEKDALLRLDDKYRDGCLLIEEINVQYSNVRRFMSNTNVDFNEVCQQLRKFHTSMLFNVIDEMFVDPQLRALTDIFIKTYDMAFDEVGLEFQKDTGQDFSWRIYPMSAYLAGEQKKYVITKRTLPPVLFHFEPWRGIFNTDQHQEKGIYSMSTKDRNKKLMAEISVTSSPEMTEHMNQWGWVYDLAKSFKEQGITQLEPWELKQYLGMPISSEVKDILHSCGIHYNRHKQAYTIEEFDIERERDLAAVS